MGPNTLLGSLLDEAGMSRAGLAKRVNDLAAEAGRSARYDHTSVGRWLRGQRPRPWAVALVCTAIRERLHRPVCAADAGLEAPGDTDPTAVPLDAFVDRAPWCGARTAPGGTTPRTRNPVVEPGETIEDAARREMVEETGWRPGKLRHLATVEPSNGFSDATHHIYWSPDGEYVGPPVDDFESDRVEWVPLKDVPDMVARGEARSANAVAGLLMLHRLRGL